MKRESHLFAGHKFLEATGSQLLIHLAKVDFRDTQEIRKISSQIKDYVTSIENHAAWEEEFIFNQFFTQDEMAEFFGEHTLFEKTGTKLIEGFNDLLNTDTQSRFHKGKLIYLDFRIYYASILAHFHSEETSLLSLLQDRATDDEIKAIDKPIYENMNSIDMIEMLKHLLPPINFSEKKSILDDLKRFNATNFGSAIPEIRKILNSEEAGEIFGEHTE